MSSSAASSSTSYPRASIASATTASSPAARDERLAQARERLQAPGTATGPEHEAAAHQATGSALATLLRRPHDRHRDVRGRLPAQARADHQDRHVMTVPPCICRRTEHRCRRSLAGRGGARLPPHAPQQIEPRSPAHRTGQCSLARRPHPIASPACSARRRSPQSSNPSATAKSP